MESHDFISCDLASGHQSPSCRVRHLLPTMPHIEELPLSTKNASAPGWAYVPDTGYDPSKVSINPSQRKRRAVTHGGLLPGSELTARQATALQRRLVELDRDIRKDTEIPVPKRDESKRGKITTNVKKILQSQKTWVNWLDDEEALLRQAAAMPPPGFRRQEGRKDSSRRISSVSQAHPSPTPGPQSTEDVEMIGSDNVPPLPTEEEINSLLSIPPLSYNAAKCAPPDPLGPPSRRFCEMCGYWGRVKCLRCGGRVCGKACMDVHQEPGGGCRGVFG